MDINEFMKKSIELQERMAEALEGLVKAGFQQTNIAHHTCGKTTATSTEKQVVEGADKPADEHKKDEPKKTAAKVEETTKVEETKQTKVTVDDARDALKKYAAIEGNDAAMELLTSLGATSVSSLAEQGEDKLRELISKCGG